MDLTRGTLARDEAAWTHPAGYAACQALAGDPRLAEMVRDRGRGR